MHKWWTIILHEKTTKMPNLTSSKILSTMLLHQLLITCSTAHGLIFHQIWLKSGCRFCDVPLTDRQALKETNSTRARHRVSAKGYYITTILRAQMTKVRASGGWGGRAGSVGKTSLLPVYVQKTLQSYRNIYPFTTTCMHEIVAVIQPPTSAHQM